MAEDLRRKFPQVNIHVYRIRNDFFGAQITVSGLLTGQDLAAQLQNVPLGEELLLPLNMLRSGESVFLDDMTVSGLEEILRTPVRIVGQGGDSLLAACLGEENEHKPYRPYEPEGVER